MPIHTLRAQPLLLALAAEDLTEPVRVIIQKTVQDQSVEEKVISLGGQIIKQLHIINATLVDLPASAIPILADFAGVRWISLDAPVAKSASDGGMMLRDDFSGDLSGLGAWSGKAWQEIGESDGAEAGDVAITQFLGGELQGLRLQNSAKGIQGFANLAGATAATLTFSYRRKDFDDANDYVVIEASADDGVTWAEVGRLAGPATDPGIALASFDLSPYLGANFTLRFVTSAVFDTLDKFYLDFLQITYAPKAESENVSPVLGNALFLPLVTSNASVSSTDVADVTEQQVSAASTDAIHLVADYFGTASFSNNDGAQNWANSWSENDSGGVGISVGHVQVANGALRLDDNPDSGTDPSVARSVNLDKAAGVRLSFYFSTASGVDSNDAAVIEVSKDGGATYTVLETFTGITGSASGWRSYNVTRFASSNFKVRFRISANYGAASEYFYADNVQISYEKVGNGSGTVTLIPVGAEWKYLDNGSNQGSSWRSSTFDDSSWPSGQAQLGYGQSDEATVVSYGSDDDKKYVTTYLRRSFTVADKSTFSGLTIYLWYDDGAVVYINGQEVARGNMPSGAVSYTTLASVDNAASLSNSYSVASSVLVNGENVIAVELHQASKSSSDLSFDLRLDGATTCVDCIQTSTLANVGWKTIRADSLWNGTARLQGQGVTVAVVDSGIAPHHDIDNGLNEDRVLQHVNFVSTQNTVDDLNGHGSHIAGTIGGNGARSTGAYPGVAPKANLLDVRVTNDWGAGTTADVVAGLEWILNNKNTYNIRVVNMSLNSVVAQSYHTSPLDAAVEILWFNGIVVVVSAGNNGILGNGVIYPPANDPFVITVGAADDRGTSSITDDQIPIFSAYGTTSDGFTKPDLVAPGKNIISLLASDDGNLSLLYSLFRVTSPSGYTYFRMSGTSMASAVTAGAVALLLQDEPNLTPDQVKYRLMNTANKNWTNYTAAKAGAGYLDIYAAVNGTSSTNANTGIAASQLLWTGSTPVVWSSVNWNSVNWNSVNWNSVNWNSVNWNSVNWSSDYWDE